MTAIEQVSGNASHALVKDLDALVYAPGMMAKVAWRHVHGACADWHLPIRDDSGAAIATVRWLPV